MKKFLLSLFALLSFVISAQAQTYFEVGGIRYRIWQESWDENPGEVYVAKSSDESNGYIGDITIPASVVYTKTYKVTGIESDAFKECSGLTSVTIPDGVTRIEDRAFQDCTGLTSITIPNSVTWIGGSGTFSGCSKLTSVTLSNQLTTVEWNTFQDCTSLTSIIIPNSVTAIGSSAFRGCSKLGEVTIGDHVKTIDGSAFQDCTSLSSIIIPNSVKEINWSVFSGCTSLTSVEIPNSVKTIGGSVFSGCTSLVSVTIPNSVTKIEGSAFSGCTSLTSIEIPTSVTKIENSTFSGCESLSSITIPDGVTKIESNAFFGCKSLTSIIIPNSVTTIGDNNTGGSVFSNCSKLTSVTLSNQLTSIPSWTFGRCTSLTSITIPSSVTSIGEYAFNGCTSLSSITIPSSVTEIKNGAFGGCNNLKIVTSEITTPFKVEAFDWNQADNATLVVPDGSLDAYNSTEGWNFAFIVEEGDAIYAREKIDEQGLKYTLKQGDDNSFYYSVKKNSDEISAEIVIPSDIDGCPVKVIEEWAFSNCKTLTKITIPSSVSTIGEYAFNSCALEEVNIVIKDYSDFFKNHILGALPNNPIGYDNNGSWVSKFYNVHLIDSEGTEILECNIPNDVTTIGVGTFKSCTGLYSVTIPNSVTSIDKDAFRDCSNLVSVKMGKKVTSIGDYAFYNCSSLESITLPKELESIGSFAFSGDDVYTWSEGNKYIPFTSIVIPKSVKSIGNGAFRGCRELGLVNFENVEESEEGGLTSLGDEAFRYCALTSVALPNSVITIGKGAFADNNKLTTATLGAALTEIKDETFQNCTELTSVTIPEGVTGIGVNAFKWCYKLSSVRIPQSLSSMGENAFDGCPIKSIELPDAFTAIPANLFKNNDLEYIKLGNNVKSIGKGAFGSKLDGEEALVLIEINTPTPPTIASDAFSALEDVSVINVIVPDATAESAYKKAAVWKEMTFANKETVVELSVGTPGDLGYELITELGVTPAKVVSLKVKGAINDKDFDQMRSNMKSLLRLDLSECDITEIPDGAMKDKTQLQELILPAKLQTIGNNAFQGCPYLTGKLDLPSGVISIGDFAFEGTYYTSVTLPIKLQKIGIHTFNSLPLKQKLVLPQSLTSIGDGAFADTQVSGYVEIPNGITYLGYGAFRNTQIESAALPDNPNGITSISSGLFQGCTNFKAYPLYIPSTYTSVEGYAFDGCTALTNVRLSANLVSIGEYAFQNTQLDYINVPSKVETIGTGAFKNCKSLVMLSLPATLKMVGPEGLRGCSALRNLSVEAIVPPAVDKSSMIGVNTDLCLISIPTESYRSYVTADYWGQFVQMRNDIAVETEGDGEIGFESVDENEEGQEALARARARRISAARAMTRASEE